MADCIRISICFLVFILINPSLCIQIHSGQQEPAGYPVNTSVLIASRSFQFVFVNEDQLENALPPCYEALQKDYLVNWTAETPNLYTLVISLKHTNGDIIEATGCKVGFRTVEIKDKQLMQ